LRIGGNRILHDGAGVSALTRVDRDVLAQPGVTNPIILVGINDIGWPHKPTKFIVQTLKMVGLLNLFPTDEDLSRAVASFQ
jgi:lysophospholipase L1-like esterase